MVCRLDLDSENEFDDGISLCFIYLDSWKQKQLLRIFLLCAVNCFRVDLIVIFFILCLGILKVHTKLILVYYLY